MYSNIICECILFEDVIMMILAGVFYFIFFNFINVFLYFF